MRTARRSLRRLVAGAAGLVMAATVLAACDSGPLPSRIQSLAVLPADVAPYHQLTERAAGDYVTQSLVRTGYRVVGAESVARLLSSARNQDLYRRFRDQAKTGPEVALPLAQTLADVVNAQGLLLPQLAVSVVGPAEGRVSLSMAIFDRYTGLRVWRNRRERGFVGSTGDPGFLRAVKEMADEIIQTLPEPPEEGQ